MKNLILTFSREENYGAVLQTYALQRVCNKYSNTDVLNYSLKKNKGIKTIIKEILYFPKSVHLKYKYLTFANKRLNLTKKVRNIKEVEHLCIQYDNIICGSDQIWNTEITENQEKIFFLNFDISNKTRKYSYAASLGTDKPLKKNLELIKENVHNYKQISVREESGKRILEDLNFENVRVDLDPTLLLNYEEWRDIASKRLIKENYIFVYLLEYPDEIINLISEIAVKLDLLIVCPNVKNKFKSEAICSSKFGPQDFVSLVDNAEYVITNSFHGTVFSIIFKKKFLIFLHSKRFTRQENILEKLNLKSKICGKNVVLADALKILESDIDYIKTFEILNKERSNSLDYVKKICGETNE